LGGALALKKINYKKNFEKKTLPTGGKI